ncbi:MAG: hypothetical protein HZB81_08300 [Deltaproteobacteria bacterium]|nr:hypothetical protein [Deltaproteobacteria bacterium]
MIPIDYDVIVFKEDATYIAYCPELDVSSCGNTVEHAKAIFLKRRDIKEIQAADGSRQNSLQLNW